MSGLSSHGVTLQDNDRRHTERQRARNKLLMEGKKRKEEGGTEKARMKKKWMQFTDKFILCNWTGPHIYFDIMHCTCALWETFSTLKFVKSRTDRRLPRVLGHWWAAETCWGDSSCFKVGPVSFVDMFCFHYNLIWPKHGEKWKALPPFPFSLLMFFRSKLLLPTSNSEEGLYSLCSSGKDTYLCIYCRTLWNCLNTLIVL